ncbi:hypothetical protein PR048_020033 [Dryococelus australis]|uniref:Uncharacterized protein n=1 Tax=Dryococelus australis TaxID=614101 RepID=A0ABQ9H565_9NEOP|nr:hypothetical protein PR048_020033 [Dryococelus australis]
MFRSVVHPDFCILGALSVFQKRLRQYFMCFRTRPTVLTPAMGSLPSDRVTAVSQDWCRLCRTSQHYAAIPLELISNLARESFLAAFHHFLARHGHCSDIFNDYRTNFVDPSGHMTVLQAFFSKGDMNECFAQALLENQVMWHFSTPAALHFGGLWEAMAKAANCTLSSPKRLTLNSWPFCTLSNDTNDPSDLPALTSSYFLVQDSLEMLLKPGGFSININRLPRWQLIEQAHQVFFFLEKMVTRLPGAASLSKILTCLPLCWKLSHVVKVFSGLNCVVRVAQVSFCILWLSYVLCLSKITIKILFIKPAEVGTVVTPTTLSVVDLCDTAAMPLYRWCLFILQHPWGNGACSLVILVPLLQGAQGTVPSRTSASGVGVKEPGIAILLHHPSAILDVIDLLPLTHDL